MTRDRRHHVITEDGVTIAGTVHGSGPPLVFVQGVIGDGDLDWQHVLPHLADRFTCHLPSTRGRGASGSHPDLSLGRLADDVLTYVRSLDGPARLVGWSLGAGVALTAASIRPHEVDAVVAVGPMMPGLMGEHERAAFGAAVVRTGELAAEGRLPEAARALAGAVFDEHEVAAAEELDYLAASARYIPHTLAFLQQQAAYAGPVPWDPDVLGAITASVLALHGSETRRSSDGAGARHVAEHVPGARVQEIAGGGHALPLTHPQPLADALAEWLDRVAQHA